MDYIYNMVSTQFFKEDTHVPGLGIALGGAVQCWTFPIATGQQLYQTLGHMGKEEGEEYGAAGLHSMYQTLGLSHMGKEEGEVYRAGGLIFIRAALPSAAFDCVVSTQVVCYEHLGHGSIPFYT